MSKDIVIFEDGKISRGSRAKLIKRGNKRVLIEFVKYNYTKKLDELVCEWFKIYIPSYSSCKKYHKHNNKRKYASYCHNESNEFYNDCNQTNEVKQSIKKYYKESYYNSLYG